MNAIETRLIRSFFKSITKLQNRNIVRSDQVMGNIGEWICVKEYGLVLETSGRHPGYDGKINDEKVQVKVHNSPKGTNLSVGDPDKYNLLILLIGPRSRLRIGTRDESFHSYRFTSSEVKSKMARNTGHYCAKGILIGKEYESIKYSA